MTELLERVINQIKELPVEDQDAIATRLMEELQDELKWNHLFSKTTDQQWMMIVDQVRQEINQGEIYSLDEIINENL